MAESKRQWDTLPNCQASIRAVLARLDALEKPVTAEDVPDEVVSEVLARIGEPGKDWRHVIAVAVNAMREAIG